MDGRRIVSDKVPQIVRTEAARGISLIDIDTDEIIYMNKYAKEMLQLPSDDESYYGCKCYTVMQRLDERCSFCHNALLQTEKFLVEEIYQPYIQQWLEVKSILLEHNGRRLRFEVMYNQQEDELEQQKQFIEEKLVQMRWTDTLTGLYNREKYILTLQELTERKNTSVGIVDMDINGLRDINATKGMQAGDQALTKLADIVRHLFDSDSFRIGSDEFVGLLIGCTKKEFEDKVETLKDELSKGIEYGVSVGRLWCDSSDDIYKKVSQASAVMEATKFLSYKDRGKDYNHRAESAHQLQDEIAAGRFTVYLQPKINLRTGALEGAEALVRKFDENGRIVTPDKFIPEYEEKGLIGYIDTFVLKNVCQILKKWQEQGRTPFKVSVNVSRVTLMAEDIIKSGAEICRQYGIDTKFIDVEITESFGLLEKELLVDLITRLHEAGFSISVDDFGTSFSNLELLAQVNFDTVKFDRSLVYELVDNTKAQSVLKAGIFMCREFGDTLTLAEGIETKEQLELLQKLGCQQGQGYYFSRPLPPEEFLRQWL